MKKLCVLAFLLASTPAFAQQQQVSASTLAVDVISNVSAMAKVVEQQTAIIQQLQAKVKELQTELDEEKKRGK